MNLNELINAPQFSLNSTTKNLVIKKLLNDLHQLHWNNSSEYKKICQIIYNKSLEELEIDEIPFLPVSIFKNYNIKSINDSDIFKILTSSGTTGQSVSKIFLNRETAQLQSLALTKIITPIIGKDRLPMLIVDSKQVLSNKSTYSARGAGILGLSIFGKNHTYVLDESFNIDYNNLIAFLNTFNGKPILIFGFTYMIWQYLFEAKLNNNYDLSQAILIHSGGWKKMTEIAVDNNQFKASLRKKYGIKHVYNFYGMVEQVGSIFIENDLGYLHCPNFADVIIRNPVDFSIQPNGQEGLIQVLSTLPKSYPGHSILTEDIGVVLGEDNAKNGWKGKYFKIIGRVEKAELRGCSDTQNNYQTI